LEDLPPVVRKIVREQSGGREITDIDWERYLDSGQMIWEVEFQREGGAMEIHVAEDGTLLPAPMQSAKRGAATQSSPGSAAGTPPGPQAGSAQGAILGTDWEDIPKLVQQRAASFGGKEKLLDIDCEDRNGSAAYELEFRREGRNLEISFAEDGLIFESSDPDAARPEIPRIPGKPEGTPVPPRGPRKPTAPKQVQIIPETRQ
jgi:uncharacterized membrane protein YkoI